MPFPPSDKSMGGVIRDTRERLDLVERRLAVGGTGGSSAPYDAEPGMVIPFSGTTIPAGWLLCDGLAVSRSTYSALFAVIGTTYGPGDGSTTFNLPNYKGRVLVGQDPGQTEFDVLGEVGGEKAHTLTIAEMPSHIHIEGWAGVNASAAYGVTGGTPNGNINQQSGQSTANHALTSPQGGGGAHNNLQPYAVAQYIISTGQGVGGGTFNTSGGGSGTTIVQSGRVLLRPTNVQGGTVDGYVVNFTNSTAISFNNIFDSALYDDYIIECVIHSATNGGWIRMRKGGVDTTDNTYGSQLVYNNSAGAFVTEYAVAGGWAFLPIVGLHAQFTAQISAATAPPGRTAYLDLEALSQQSSFIVNANHKGTHNGKNYDGFTLQSAGGGITGFIKVYGLSKTGGQAIAGPTNQWQEFHLAATSGTAAAPGNQVVWDGPVTGNLGATLSADKKTITLPEAGTYRVLPHIGIAGSPAGAANANADINGASYTPSFGYGTSGPAGAWSYDTEFYITTTGPTTLRYAINPAALYFWSWLRVEKQEAVNYGTALAVQQGSTSERDGRYGIPTTDSAKVSLANQVPSWFNTDKGWYETYYATTGTAGLTKPGLRTGFPSGWYPQAGSPIYATVRRAPAQAVAANTAIDLGFDQVLSQHGFTTLLPAPIIIPYSGDYELGMSAVASQSANNFLNLYWFRNGVQQWIESGSVYPHAGGYSRSILEPTINPLLAGDSVSMKVYLSSAGNIEANTARITLRYISPPFAP